MSQHGANTFLLWKGVVRAMQVAWIALLVAAVWLCKVHVAEAQSAHFEDAKEAYEAEQYEKAVALFSEIAEDTALDEDVRRAAWRYLGRAYVAKDQHDEARHAIEQLLQLEPPRVVFDPDEESPPLLRLYYEVRMEMTGFALDERSGIQTLAVMDFENNSVDERERYAPLQRGLPSMMINNLSGATDLRVIEREQLQWLLEEQELQRDPSLIDQETAVETGRLIGASAVVSGSYTIHGDEMWLSARLVDVETSEILFSEEILGRPDAFFDLIRDLSTQVTRALGGDLEAIETVAGETRSLDAMMAYSQGLEQLEEGNYHAAYVLFTEAADLDPGYARAARRAESLRSLAIAPWGLVTSLTAGYSTTSFHFSGSHTASPFDFSEPLMTLMVSSPRASLSVGYGTSTVDQVARQLLDISGAYGGNVYIARSIEDVPLALFLPIRASAHYRYIHVDLPAGDPSLFPDEFNSRHLASAGLGAGAAGQFRLPDVRGMRGIPVLGHLVLEGSILFVPGGYVDVREGFESTQLSRARDINVELRLERLLRSDLHGGLGVTFGFTHRTLSRTTEQPASFGDVISATLGEGTLDRISVQSIIRVGINW